MLGGIILTEESSMAKDASVRAFKCPTCGAPLEPEAGTLTMKCSYCGGTVIIPESLRMPPPSAGPTLNEAFQFGLNGVDLNQIVGNAMHLPQAISLAQQGRVDEAANIYSQITGMDHKDAMKAIEDLAAGRAVSLTPGRAGVTWGQAEIAQAGANIPSTFSGETYAPTASTAPKVKSGGGFDLGYLIGSSLPIIIVLIVVCSLIAAFGSAILGFLPHIFSSPASVFSGGNPIATILPPGFGTNTLTFGSKGIGPGMFTDARAIAVGSNGNIIVGDYQDGRVQIFDPSGKFISLISLGPKISVDSLAVGRDGKIYVLYQGKIAILDSTGKLLKTISDDQRYYVDAALGPDGTLYAATEDDSIVHFNQNVKINLEITKAFENVTGDGESEAKLAVDGLGNIYAVGNTNYLVFKFSPAGKYLDQFGGEADPANIANGKFVEPSGIVIDGYGRIFVSDIFGNVQAFDSTGAYLNSFNAEAYGMAIDDQNNIYVTLGDQVEKFTVQKPSGQ